MVTNKAIRKTSTVIICSIMQNARICQGMLCDKNKNRNSEDTGNERINLLYMSVSISLYKSTRVESLVILRRLRWSGCVFRTKLFVFGFLVKISTALFNIRYKYCIIEKNCYYHKKTLINHSSRSFNVDEIVHISMGDVEVNHLTESDINETIDANFPENSTT